MNCCHNILWERNACFSVSINLSWELTDFVVELTLLSEVSNKLFNSEGKFSTRNSIINGFHHINSFVKVLCGTCYSGNSSLNWYSLFKANCSSSSDDWLRILANVLWDLNDVIENNFSLIPELFPEVFAILFRISKFLSHRCNRLIAWVNCCGISVSKRTQNLIFDMSDVISFEGGSNTIRLLGCWSILVTKHDVIGLRLGSLVDISIMTENVTDSLRTHTFAAWLGKPVVLTIVVRGAGFSVSQRRCCRAMPLKS